jgi:hypothetical protein
MKQIASTFEIAFVEDCGATIMIDITELAAADQCVGAPQGPRLRPP